MATKHRLKRSVHGDNFGWALLFVDFSNCRDLSCCPTKSSVKSKLAPCTRVQNCAFKISVARTPVTKLGAHQHSSDAVNIRVSQFPKSELLPAASACCPHSWLNLTRQHMQRQQELKVRTWVTWLYKNQIARQPRQQLFRIVRRNCYTEEVSAWWCEVRAIPARTCACGFSRSSSRGGK